MQNPLIKMTSVDDIQKAIEEFACDATPTFLEQKETLLDVLTGGTTARTGRANRHDGIVFTPEEIKSITERVDRDGLQSATLYYTSQHDTRDQLIAGRLELYSIYEKTSGSFPAYLWLMRPLMRERQKVELGTGIDFARYDNANYDDLPSNMKLYLEMKAVNNTIKVNKPNNVWIYMWLNRNRLFEAIDTFSDYQHVYHSISVFANTYLTKSSYKDGIIERPQFLHMRVAAQLYGELSDPTSIDRVIKCYHEMSTWQYVPASPTMFNAGMTYPQMSSCFLHSMSDDMRNILEKYAEIGIISKFNGANGISLTNLRSQSAIGNSGLSEGIKPVIKNVDGITGQVDQGGKRNGASQLTVGIWHVDAPMLIAMSDKTKVEQNIVKHAHTSIFLNWIFFDRIRENGNWSLFCPSEVPQLLKTHGLEFNKWYKQYEAEGKARVTVNARTLLEELVKACIHSGMPFAVNGDSVNGKTNQSNIGDGIILCLNLCQEVPLVADDFRVPSCNLSATCIPSFLDFSSVRKSGVNTPDFNWSGLGCAARAQVRNLNKVIEKNFYPLPQIEFANWESAPIGIGMMGFATLLNRLNLTFSCPEALEWTTKIQACIYYNAVLESMLIAKERGYPYRAFKNSPFSRGELQFDMWVPEDRIFNRETPHLYEPSEWGQEGSWAELKANVVKYGTANSQLTTCQPTASSSMIVRITYADGVNGNVSEACEPSYGNLFVRKILTGEFRNVNPYLQADLDDLGLWNGRVVNYLRKHEGSIVGLTESLGVKDAILTTKLKFLEQKYLTAFELKQRVILDHAAARGRYIDMSQSTSLYWAEPNIKKITNALTYANEIGVKTGCYYTRSLPVRSAVKFTLEEDTTPVKRIEINEAPMCRIDNPECLSCM